MSTVGRLLSVKEVADHLGLNEGQVSRKCGVEGGIPAVKVVGPGLIGRGGQWRIDADRLLEWLAVAPEDRDGDRLPPVITLKKIAARHGVSPASLRRAWRREVRFGRAFGRGDVLLPPHAARLVTMIAAEMERRVKGS